MRLLMNVGFFLSRELPRSFTKAKNFYSVFEYVYLFICVVLAVLGGSNIRHFPRYTSGDVRLWDTLHWDSGASNLQPAHSIRDETPPPYVSLVRVTDAVACAAYENGERVESFCLASPFCLS